MKILTPEERKAVVAAVADRYVEPLTIEEKLARADSLSDSKLLECLRAHTREGDQDVPRLFARLKLPYCISSGIRARAPTTIEILTEGSPEEVRDLLGSHAQLWLAGAEPSKSVLKWLAHQLIAIAQDRVNANVALRVAPSKPGPPTIGVRERIHLEHLIDDLNKQAIPLDEATSIVERFNPDTWALDDDPDDKAGERLRKRLSRAKKRTK